MIQILSALSLPKEKKKTKKETPQSQYQGHTNATQIHAILWSWTDYPGFTLTYLLRT